ncbi:MAG: alpha/beta fold hydrolase [Candidatus Latescibacteria bacterium]|nr:alpha/beta fold hydrolase [Candidatus Latescibacterota bacterium]NIM64536.1 alpha/beta fold hydrolase [Candidatus Latescibacterota bacterium]NIO00689.1 alpha/beta fold hydrolase [Candidatus Latescibacterota bacterium]NIO27092.1 alpha/beta fold hydrolase [Candidatus Latescibacterota bacterium]NIO54616.1 alpha/beta fold hydrolase [Candidatus Latescibacterota bacterium]
MIDLKEITYEIEHSTLTEQGALTAAKSFFLADSGTIALPENRNDPSTRMIELPIIRIRATGNAVGVPVFWFGGGPGRSNLSTFGFDYFIERHDHVMFGYRGVDGSISLDCPEVVRVLKRAKDVLTDETIADVGDAYEACAARLEQEGVDINGYTTFDVIGDAEAVRKALGYDKINIISESYGTRLAYLYGVKYPDRVHRSVMIGANPPGRLVWDPYQADELLRHYGKLWSEDLQASAKCPDLVNAVREVNENMPRHWLFLPIYPGNVKAAAFAVLSERKTAKIVFDAYCAAARGDPSGLWLASFAARYIFPEIVNWGDNASKAVSADFDPSRDYANEMIPEDAVMGAPLGRFLWGPGGHWPIDPIPEEYRRLRRCDVETLILSGTLDFTTPAVNAQNDLLPYLPNGRQIVMAEFGHLTDIWTLQPSTTYRILTSFLETGVPDVSTLTYEPMDFEVRWGYPRIAKLIIAGVLLSVLIVAVLIWQMLRVVRRRRINRIRKAYSLGKQT